MSFRPRVPRLIRRLRSFAPTTWCCRPRTYSPSRPERQWRGRDDEVAALGRQRSWLVVEPLPGYAPELNPVQGLWASLKGVELANLAGNTLQEVTAAAEGGVQRIRGTPHLAFSFLRYCGLSLW